MRRLLIILGAALVLSAIAAFSGVGLPDSASGDVTPPDSVTTVGHGVMTAIPDQAIVNAGVHTQAATAADALAQNSRLMNAVIAALKSSGGSNLQTQQVSLYPQTGDNGQVQGFVADNSVSAKAKIADAGSLVDAAVAAGANTVSGPTLDVSDSDALYRQALQKALADARLKAQALATAGNFALGTVSSVTEQSTQSPGPVFAQSAAAKDAATPVEPGTQDISADVTVTFKIH
jgi:uncharacterized protein